jgi:hypothetical protein
VHLVLKFAETFVVKVLVRTCPFIAEKASRHHKPRSGARGKRRVGTWRLKNRPGFQRRAREVGSDPKGFRGSRRVRRK